MLLLLSFFFSFNDPSTTEIYTLSLHDALPIYAAYFSVQLTDKADAKTHLLARFFSRECVTCSNPVPDCCMLHTQDRKSTRLNSSHSQISYAVFCLKKKKNTKQKNTINIQKYNI